MVLKMFEPLEFNCLMVLLLSFVYIPIMFSFIIGLIGLITTLQPSTEFLSKTFSTCLTLFYFDEIQEKMLTSLNLKQRPSQHST